jgi:hypothetical protein
MGKRAPIKERYQQLLLANLRGAPVLTVLFNANGTKPYPACRNRLSRLMI